MKNPSHFKPNPNAPSHKRTTRLACRVSPSFASWLRGMSSTLGDGSVSAMLERLAREEAVRKGYRDGPER